MSTELKIKSKHLAAEPDIIKFEEAKLAKKLKWIVVKYQGNIPAKYDRDYRGTSRFWPWEHEYWKTNSAVEKLRLHRKTVVRNEARATFLARAFIAGKPYNDVESKRKDEELFVKEIFPKIVRMVQKYHPDYSIAKDAEELVKVWCAA